MSDFAEKIEKMMSEASLENSSSKFLVEYEDYNSETSDLLDVLSGIGLAEKNRVVCKVFVMTPITGIHPYDWPEWGIGVVVTEFYEELTREKFLDKTFQKILKGEFEQQTPDNIEFVYSKSPELKEILSKPNIVERAKKIESSPLPPTGKTSKIDKLFMGLVSEVLDLMKKLIDKRARMLDDEYEKTLDENMGYSIQIDKI